MKLSPFVLLASALGSRTISASNTKMELCATKNSVTNLRLKIFMAMQDRVRKFNNLKHGEKREISFDPDKLGCRITNQKRLKCDRAKVSDNFGTSGIVIHENEEQILLKL